MLHGQDLLDVIKGDLVEVNLTKLYKEHLKKRKKDWTYKDAVISANYSDTEERIRDWCNIQSEDFEFIVRFKKEKKCEQQ